MVNGLYILKISIVAEGAGLQVVWEKGRGVIWGGGPTREGAVGRVSFAVLMVGELVGDAAVGLGWGEPADREAQRMQVHVAHSLKVEAVGIHGGLGRMAGREGQGLLMCRTCMCADACVFLVGETGEITTNTFAPGCQSRLSLIRSFSGLLFCLFKASLKGLLSGSC